MPKRLVILGSTGSIGRQTLEIVEAHADDFDVIGLAAGTNTSLLLEQIARFHPRWVWANAPLDRNILPPGCGIATMEEMASLPEADLVVAATVGRAGIEPTLAALRAGRLVMLANKEVLVTAGPVVVRETIANNTWLLPIDSEHSALWMCLLEPPGAPQSGRVAAPDVANPDLVSRLILTASGGAFRDMPVEQLQTVTPDQAIRHPNWVMGRKVTVDSATLMNKGLEVLEAHWLFGTPYEKIDVLLHHQSIIHSLVEYIDGAMKAQLSLPDMRLPIQYGLTYPTRLPALPNLPRLDLAKLGKLTFGEVDLSRYPCLTLALEAGRRGGTYPAVLSGADEEAVELFLTGKIPFTGIPRLVERALAAHRSNITDETLTLEAALAADEEARRTVREAASL